MFSDLIACAGLAVTGSVLAAMAIDNPIRVVLGIGLIFLLPGYALSSVLWGSEAKLSFTDRIVFVVGLSVSLVVLSVILLSVTGVGIGLLSVSLSLGYETLVLCILGTGVRWRRQDGPPREILEAVSRLRLFLREDRAFWTVVAALLLVAVILVYLNFSEAPPPLSTQFYVFGPDGTIGTLPRDLAVNQTAALVVGVQNGATTDVPFVVTVCLVPGNVSCPSQSILNSTWTSNLSLTPATSYVLNLTVPAGSLAQNALTFAVAVSGSYVLSLTLNGGGLQREARIPLTVTP